MKTIFTRSIFFTLTAALAIFGGCSSYQTTSSGPHFYFNPDTVTANKFDNGKMWTFDFPPVHYFKDEYNFSPDSAWFADTRLAALRLPGCSASFISEDGLVLTNHHCARYALDKVNRPGEDLPDSGFYAPTLADERKVDGMYADQLVLIKDVTAEVQKAFETGTTDQEKVAHGEAEMRKIENEYREKFKETAPADSMIFQVVTFYNGGQYSLYGYRRYTDVRLVFAPQMIVAYFGGDYDNFTYPRYDLDCALFRVYGNDGKPLRSDHYFKWSTDGAKEGQPVFVIGNPGRTGRLISVAQLEFNRDYAYPYTVKLLDELQTIYTNYIADHPGMKLKYQTRLFGISNSLKAYNGMLEGLRDPYLMARKEAFEREFKGEVEKNPALEEKYGTVWDDLANVEAQKDKLFYKHIATDLSSFASSEYFRLAANLVRYAREMQMPESERPAYLKGDGLAKYQAKFFPSDFDPGLQKEFLAFQLSEMQSTLGNDDGALRSLLGGQSPKDAADQLVAGTSLGDSSKVAAMLTDPGSILISPDPFIKYVVATQTESARIQNEYNKLMAEETADNLSMGRALYEVYGTSIPPDATFTLRIADGVVEGYPYNGTIAPPMTTFYGMYNRYYGFGKKYPWALPSDWQNPPADFNLSTPLDFVMTSDIIGGNSGSAVINENRHLVGLIFDGNIESLPGSFIYVPSVNRAVAVHSDAIPQALQYIYHANRIVNEIKTGKIEQ